MSNFGFILLKIISFATWFQRSKRYLYCARNVGQISHYAEQLLTVTMVMMQYKHKCKKGAVESKLHVCKSHPLLPAGQKALRLVWFSPYGVCFFTSSVFQVVAVIEWSKSVLGESHGIQKIFIYLIFLLCVCVFRKYVFGSFR